ncbi:unnamed protein product [Echinostoma caproni]|uniref:Secreted protein n=1 Tax=Echinostoma caproni TaxID=27848 RepID=A0A183BFZ3_9TREM|nr:unnamed protein product [Echinostoma caproni]
MVSTLETVLSIIFFIDEPPTHHRDLFFPPLFLLIQSAALAAEQAGNSDRASSLLSASLMIEEVIPKIEAGLEPFDVETDLPPPPDEFETDEPETPQAPPEQAVSTVLMNQSKKCKILNDVTCCY